MSARLNAASGDSPRRLGVVFLRGAVDGLSVVVPYADPGYHAARSSKCDRVGSGDPQACTKPSAPDVHSGSSGASAGCRPKRPSRSSVPPALPGRPSAIDDRAAW